ncbi:MAG: hypothetical protein CMJ68_09840 [Planctomycetaceae bacterium]|nr:hypothetical protein [Planctomycetaceae bacterium]
MDGKHTCLFCVIRLLPVLLLLISNCASQACAEPLVVPLSQEPRVMNNFVVQLLDVTHLPGDRRQAFRFKSPRDGWLFFRVTAGVGRGGAIAATLSRKDAATARPLPLFSFSSRERKTREVMRHLPRGEYTLQIELKNADIESLVVRKVPIIMYQRVPGNFRSMPGFPEYNRRFLARCGMLSACNTIGTYDGFSWMKQWLESGRHTVRIAGGIGGLTTTKLAYEHWGACMEHPTGVQGTIIDEFYPGLSGRFSTWVPALKRLRAEKPHKHCYLYLAGTAKSIRGIVEPLKDQDCYFVLEEQTYEARTLAELTRDGFARNWVKGFEEYFPGFPERCIHSVGVMSGPSDSKYNDDIYPDVSYKVLKELQFHALATDPVFGPAGGVEIYQSPVCDEEYLRWCARLFRHYAIEGSRERLTDDPYTLTHIRNPDFEDGLKGWTVGPAAEGSIATAKIDGYGLNVQGRHTRVGIGDRFATMTRNAAKANEISQEIQGLEPGRYYSVRMYTGDRNNLNRWQIHNVSIRVPDAREVPQLTMHMPWMHRPVEKFGNKPTYPCYHRIVFQATKSTAKLVISDWHNPGDPTGPVGQELLFNFVQVEPYLMSSGESAGIGDPSVRGSR